MPRLVRVLALVWLAPITLAAQQTADSADMQAAYDARRAALLQELQQTQDQLADLRAQRVRLESHIDNVLAETTERRAQALLLTGDLNALLQLDAVLAQAQENMLAQRDRMLALGDAVRKRAGSVMIVLFRADSTPSGSVGSVQLLIDNTNAAARTYTTTSATALQQGAVDELYRAEVLPTVHTVQVQVMVDGSKLLTAGVNVRAETNVVTYVQFSLLAGRVSQSSWTSQGTTP